MQFQHKIKKPLNQFEMPLKDCPCCIKCNYTRRCYFSTNSPPVRGSWAACGDTIPYVFYHFFCYFLFTNVIHNLKWSCHLKTFSDHGAHSSYRLYCTGCPGSDGLNSRILPHIVGKWQAIKDFYMLLKRIYFRFTATQQNFYTTKLYHHAFVHLLTRSVVPNTRFVVSASVHSNLRPQSSEKNFSARLSDRSEKRQNLHVPSTAAKNGLWIDA